MASEWKKKKIDWFVEVKERKSVAHRLWTIFELNSMKIKESIYTMKKKYTWKFSAYIPGINEIRLYLR